MADTNTDKLPRTRVEAQAIGAKLYHTGEPCSKGHVAPRRTGNGNCTACEQGASRHTTEVDERTERALRLINSPIEGDKLRGYNILTFDRVSDKPEDQRTADEVRFLQLVEATKLRWTREGDRTCRELARDIYLAAEALSDMLSL